MEASDSVTALTRIAAERAAAKTTPHAQASRPQAGPKAEAVAQRVPAMPSGSPASFAYSYTETALMVTAASLTLASIDYGCNGY